MSIEPAVPDIHTKNSHCFVTLKVFRILNGLSLAISQLEQRKFSADRYMVYNISGGLTPPPQRFCSILKSRSLIMLPPSSRNCSYQVSSAQSSSCHLYNHESKSKSFMWVSVSSFLFIRHFDLEMVHHCWTQTTKLLQLWNFSQPCDSFQVNSAFVSRCCDYFLAREV